MARELKPATRAINAGIGERIQELGFRRKSGRLYLREDERFAEYVIFRSDGLKFYDELGIFDKDFEAFMDGLPQRGSNVSDKPGLAAFLRRRLVLGAGTNSAKSFGWMIA